MHRSDGAPTDGVAAGCRQIVHEILRVRASDTVAIIVDRATSAIGEELLSASLETGCEALMVVVPPVTGGSKEPPRRVAWLMRESSVYIIPTTISMTHTEARREATRSGARGLTLPGITASMLQTGGIFADYGQIACATVQLADRLTGVSEVRLVTDAGTDLVFDVHGGVWFAERGLCAEAGDFGNAPGGEVSIAPADVNGTLVVDGSMNPLGVLREPLRLTIRNRYVVKIEGERGAELQEYLGSFGPGGFNVAEIGIGMNPAARLTGIVLEDEKVLGTVHVGIGDNTKMGGTSLAEKVPAGVHIDGVVISNPRLFADGQLVDPRHYFQNVAGRHEGGGT